MRKNSKFRVPRYPKVEKPHTNGNGRNKTGEEKGVCKRIKTGRDIKVR